MFSSEYATLIKIDHMLVHRKRFNTFQKFEIIQNLFSNQKETKLRIKNKTRKSPAA